MTHSRMIRAWFFCVGFVRSTQGSKVIVSKREIGHVSDLLVDERTWSIRYLVVDTSNWWVGHKVLISPQWVEEVRWIDQSVSIDMKQQSVKDAPPYKSTERLNRELEIKLYRHYGRRGYW